MRGRPLVRVGIVAALAVCCVVLVAVLVPLGLRSGGPAGPAPGPGPGPGPGSAAGRGSPTAPDPADGPGLPRLTTRPGPPPVIADVTGRQVLLRGVNVNQLVDYAARDPQLPTVRPLSEDDFARIAALGATVVRLGVSWSRLEPTPGTLDPGYVADIRRAVRWAAAHGLYTVLDMHQDAWGDVASPPGTACPAGTSPAIGWDGAPRWATLLDGASTCRGVTREASPAVARAFTNFYRDRDGIQGHLVQTWARLAGAFAADPAVAGYDLLNEPNAGELSLADATAALGAYYGRAVTAVREAESAAPGGFAHLVLVEPTVLWPVAGAAAAPPPGFTTDPRLVFAPHLYAPSSGALPIPFGMTVDQGFTTGQQVAAGYGAPLWIGEWGWFGDPRVDGAAVRQFAARADALGVGGAWWVWKQACGDPHNVTATGIAPTSGNLNPYACPSGRALDRPEPFAVPLSRAHPDAAPGRITALRADPDRGTITLAGDDPDPAGSCRLQVWVPDRGLGPPQPATTGVSGLRVDPVDGGFRVTGCATGRYELRSPGA